MATIGKFKKKGDHFTGIIETRLWKTAATIQKLPDAGSAATPNYLVLAGRYEIGTGECWASHKDAAYLEITLDDPSFAAPLRCRLYEEHDGYHLAWSRDCE